MKFIVAGLALVMLPNALAAQVTPVVLEDFNRIADVAGPAFSPDGTRIAYSVSLKDAKRDAEKSDLWTVPWQGGTPVQITKTPEASEWNPRYSPDGTAIFFLSDAASKTKIGTDAAKAQAEDETQLWSMPAKGGVGRQITRLPGGISEFSLSPDGKRAVVLAETGGSVGSKAKTPPPIETERFFFKQDGRGYLDDRTQQLFVIDLATGQASQITHGARDHWHPAWSPDGSAIAYVAKDQGADDRTLNYDIYIVSPDGGVPRRISTSPNAESDPDWGSGPAWSPDSRKLVWLEGDADKWIYYGSAQLIVGDVTTGAITRPARIDRWFYQPRWTPDGRLIALIEQDRDTWLARIDPADGAITYLTQGKRFGSDYAIAPNGAIALLETDNSKPAELYALEGHRELTHHNNWLAGRALGEVRDISFHSGNAEIHGFLTLPPDYDPAKRYPLIADLHGGPVYQHSHEFDLDARLYAAAGYVVLKVNPRGSSGRGMDFSRAIYADWGHLDVKDISAGITKAIDMGVADPDRIGVGGWSYGGILTDYMIASDPRIKAAVSGAGVANVLATFGVDMYAREYLLELGAPWDNFETYRKLGYPFFHPERITAPTLFQCADADDNVPCAGAQQMYLALKTRGVPTRLIVYPGENHGLVVPSYLVHRMRSNIAWYDRWLKR
ncbi:S9 family peptidase [Sphingobium boeckii]|uniref:Dipeptidyl aminopeptidase/acylaminoacyl peptidase n=1 Tax=Sphingobium boeckii TaxID=1082345 RepID=A0A7W9EET7_9SPHN|nr:S9 family peptidase [Sphingobium boeckii]MBB5685370.1 dipeptidyl aminopeptidase/acylaminoacyl peptidase [Sphingobium boeckii]